MKGCRCSWEANQRERSEARGHVAAWHDEAEEEKGKKGVGSVQCVGKEKRGGGLVAQRRLEEESMGGP
jgi:hypothetical protein